MHAPDSFDPAVEDGPPRPRGALLPVAALALGLLFAWFTWQNYSSFQWLRFAKAFAAIRLDWFSLGLSFSLVSFLGRAIRWQVMMLPLRSSFWGVTFATYVGFSAVVLLGRAGEFVRPYLIARKENTELGSQMGVWVLERLYDFVVILLLFGLGIHYARNLGGNPGSHLSVILHVGGWVATGCAVLSGAVFYLMAHRPEFCRRRLREATTFLSAERQAIFLRSLDSFLKGVQPAAHWPNFWKSVALTVAEWAMILGGGYCYFRAFPPASGFSITDVAAYWGFTSFGAAVQLPGIGGGMQIASVFILTELFRMPLDQATGFSLLIWAGTSLIVLPIGIPLASYGGLNLAKLRRIGREAAL